MSDEYELPFPGMNPYLENRRLWPEVHNKLISDLHYFLRETLPPRYTVTMEERVIVEETLGDELRRGYAVPDLNITGSDITGSDRAGGGRRADGVAVAPDSGAVTVTIPELRPVHEWFIEIRTETRLPSVTILELLSHSNKRAGPGRRDYLAKRMRILESATHLVEIDLLRANHPMPTDGYTDRAAYRILVSRSENRPQATLYPFGMQSPIPAFAIPLLRGDAGPTLALGDILGDLYVRGYYDHSVNYAADPEGPLSDDDRAWLDRRLRQQGLRG